MVTYATSNPSSQMVFPNHASRTHKEVVGNQLAQIFLARLSLVVFDLLPSFDDLAQPHSNT
jgi:hypothetical protein